ncbi:MAG: mechanosensitive ion channel family protein [Caldilineaceae bacterium]
MEQLRSLFNEAPLYSWGVILMLGIPLLILILSEVIEYLQRRGSPLAAEVAHLRNLVLPLLSIRLILQRILGWDGHQLSIRIVETLLWLVLLYFIFRILALLVRGAGSPDSREFRLPRVWSELLRILALVGIGFYVLGALWGVPMDQVFAALGVGSIVVGFALQDTLSSLVSGMLLAFEKPFEVGHWLRYGPYEGQIIEMNWRAVRLRTRERDVVILPNGVLGKDVAVNYTALDPLHAEIIQASFTYHHPPNQVKRMLLETALATPGVIHNPTPHARIVGYAYDKFAVDYEIKYYTLDYGRIEFIRDEVLTRIYYAAQRYNFTVPYQTRILYQRDGALLEPKDPFAELLEQIKTLPYFAGLKEGALTELAHGAALQTYGAEERLLQPGDFFKGFYVILEGQAQLFIQDQQQQMQAVTTLKAGEFFGEVVLLREQPSLYGVLVMQDMQVLFIERTTLIEVVEANLRLALEMNRFIEERTKMIRRAGGMPDEEGQNRVAVNGFGKRKGQ